jgi:hypothetical protein
MLAASASRRMVITRLRSSPWCAARPRRGPASGLRRSPCRGPSAGGPRTAVTADDGGEVGRGWPGDGQRGDRAEGLVRLLPFYRRQGRCVLPTGRRRQGRPKRLAERWSHSCANGGSSVIPRCLGNCPDWLTHGLWLTTVRCSSLEIFGLEVTEAGLAGSTLQSIRGPRGAWHGLRKGVPVAAQVVIGRIWLTCAKVGHPRRVAASWSAQVTADDVRLRVCRCPVCSGWHLTSRRRPRRTSRRQHATRRPSVSQDRRSRQ